MRRNRIAKSIVIFIASIIALAMSGATYALWYEDMYIYTDVETAEISWEFWHPSWYDNPGVPPFPLLIWGDHGLDPPLYLKDVASSSHWFDDSDDDGDFDTLYLIFQNVYPYYEDHFAFAVHCNGILPIHIWKVEFSNYDGTVIYGVLYANGNVYLDIGGPDGPDVPDGEPDIVIWWGDHFGEQLHYCDSADLSFNFKVLQPCPQGVLLELLIRIVAVNYNEYEAGPIDGY
jgi:hypothetical protein